MSYEPGDAIDLTWAIDNPRTKQPEPGATVTLTVTAPGGTPQTLAPIEVSPGRWLATFLAKTSGRHDYRWQATGAAQASDSGRFHVG